VWGMEVQPNALYFLADVDEPGVRRGRGGVWNTGTEAWETWTVLTATWGLTFTVAPTTGVPGEGFTVTVDSTGYPLGVYTGVLTVTASEPEVPESPVAVPVTLHVVPQVHRLYLPMAIRGWMP